MLICKFVNVWIYISIDINCEIGLVVLFFKIVSKIKLFVNV